MLRSKTYIKTGYIMISEDFRKKMEKIVSDSSLSIEKRIDEALDLYREVEQNVDDEEEEDAYLKANLDRRIAFARSLLEMMHKEGPAYRHASEMLQLYGILAEALAEKKDYRPLKEIAYRVREIVRQDDVDWADMEESLPVILDAVNETVYNHAAYDLHMHYLRRAFMEGALGQDMKGRARRLLKLRVLLEDTSWHDYFFSKDLQDAIAALFSPSELVKIIVYPRLGHLRQDPVEFTRLWEDIYYDMEERLDERFANVHRSMGFCFMFWDAKRNLLKDEYGIDWHSPSQMNPGVMFD